MLIRATLYLRISKNTYSSRCLDQNNHGEGKTRQHDIIISPNTSRRTLEFPTLTNSSSFVQPSSTISYSARRSILHG